MGTRHHEVSPLMRKGVLRRMITSQQLGIYFMELTSSPYCRYSSSPAEAITPYADHLDLHPSIFPHSSFANSLCLQNRPNCKRLSLPLPPRTVYLGNGCPMQTTLLANFLSQCHWHLRVHLRIYSRHTFKIVAWPARLLAASRPTLSNLARGYRWCSCSWDFISGKEAALVLL